MSTKLKKRSMSNDKWSEVENTSLKSPPSIVFKNSSAIEIDNLSANWANPNHLFTLKESKQKDLTSSDKEQFLELPLQEQLRGVVYEHAPSELKMVYDQTCSLLDKHASVEFFKNGSKDKERFYEFIWENRKILCDIQDGYVSPYAKMFVPHANLYYLNFESTGNYKIC